MPVLCDVVERTLAEAVELHVAVLSALESVAFAPLSLTFHASAVGIISPIHEVKPDRPSV